MALLVQAVRMWGKVKYSAVLFALICSCAASYFTFYQAAVLVEHRHFQLPVLRWIRESSHLEEKNIVGRDFNFVIRVLAYDRLTSLQRCLRSLAAADYGGDSVSLVVFIDHFKAANSTPSRKLSGNKDSGLQDATQAEAEQIDLNILQARKMLEFVDNFHWRHGPKELHYRSENRGLQGQWIEAWWPSSDDQFAIIVEDDMELSPLYYRYVRGIISNYCYNAENADSSIFGVSLQRPRFVAGKGGRRIQVDNSTRLFLYQMVGSWGQVLFPKPWKEFRIWYDEQRARGRNPLIGGMVTSGWYNKLGDRIWTPWFIKFVHSRGYFNLYTNFLEERALSVSHRSKGVNYRKEAGPDSKLIKREGVKDIDLWEMPRLSKLKWYDFCFQEVLPGKPANSLEELLRGAQRRQTVLLIGCLSCSEEYLKNWLCQLKSLKMEYQHVLLLGKNQLEMATELARRGHAAVLLGSELQDEGELYLGAVLQALNLGHDVWLARACSAWLNSALEEPSRQSLDILAASRSINEVHPGVIFVRSNSRTREALLRSSRMQLGLDKAMQSLIQGRSKLQAQLEMQVSNISAARTFLFPDGDDEDDKQKLLKQSGMWHVDQELACNWVHCSRLLR